MTELEWKLSREVAQLKMALFQAQSQLLQANFDIAKREFDALGETWSDAPEK